MWNKKKEASCRRLFYILLRLKVLQGVKVSYIVENKLKILFGFHDESMQTGSKI